MPKTSHLYASMPSILLANQPLPLGNLLFTITLLLNVVLPYDSQKDLVKACWRDAVVADAQLVLPLLEKHHQMPDGALGDISASLSWNSR